MSGDVENPSEAKDDVRLRACPSSYVVLSVGCVPIIALSAAALLFWPNTDDFAPVIFVTSILYAFGLLWLWKIEVRLHDGLIVIKRFLRRDARLFVPEISYFEFEVGYDEESLSHSEPPVRLVFKTRNALGERRYMVGAKVFGLHDLGRFIGCLKAELGQSDEEEEELPEVPAHAEVKSWWERRWRRHLMEKMRAK